MIRKTDRLSFLKTVAGAATLPAILGADPAPAAAPKPVSHALILSGGGARGAYEAGIISALVTRAGVSDGQPLAPYGIVCGTSIGAFNAWFVATGQYAALTRAWQTLASENIFELKSKYVTLDKPHSFIGARIRAAIRLATGLTKNETGIARSEPVLSWMRRHIDPTTPVLMPMIWSVTNLTTHSPEYFYRLPPDLHGAIPAKLLRDLRFVLGQDVVVRQASDAILHRTLLASASIPVVFDPVKLQMANGATGVYVDGGIASNSNIAIARTVAEKIHVILVDPRSENEKYANAIEIVIGSYETMQRMTLESQMRDFYFQSLGRRAIGKLPSGVTTQLEDSSPILETFLHDLPAVDLAYMRPTAILPADFSSFDEQPKLDATFAVGAADGQRPFTAYEYRHFRV